MLQKAILLYLMIEVSMEFALKRETLYISINLVDRFLTMQIGISKMDLQLVGVSCMYIASKVEVFLYKKLYNIIGNISTKSS